MCRNNQLGSHSPFPQFPNFFTYSHSSLSHILLGTPPLVRKLAKVCVAEQSVDKCFVQVTNDRMSVCIPLLDINILDKWSYCCQSELVHMYRETINCSSRQTSDLQILYMYRDKYRDDLQRQGRERGRDTSIWRGRDIRIDMINGDKDNDIQTVMKRNIDTRMI